MKTEDFFLLTRRNHLKTEDFRNIFVENRRFFHKSELFVIIVPNLQTCSYYTDSARQNRDWNPNASNMANANAWFSPRFGNFSPYITKYRTHIYYNGMLWCLNKHIFRILINKNLLPVRFWSQKISFSPKPEEIIWKQKILGIFLVKTEEKSSVPEDRRNGLKPEFFCPNQKSWQVCEA